MKKLMIVAAAAVMAASVALGSSQTSDQAKSGSAIDSWSQGLTDKDVKLVDRITNHKSERDKWMIWTAIVRNREASQDIYSGEHLSDNKVLANVRVHMTTKEAKLWAGTRSRLGSTDRRTMIAVLRDDLATKR
jgi:hypothetical protein